MNEGRGKVIQPQFVELGLFECWARCWYWIDSRQTGHATACICTAV